MSSKRLILLMHSRTFARLAFVVSVLGVVIAWQLGGVTPLSGEGGILLSAPSTWLGGSPVLSLCVNVAILCGIVVFMEFVLKLFNVLRTVTDLPSALAAIMLMATPALMGQLCGGTLICLLMWGLTAIMFSTFGVPYGTQRRIFLIFFALVFGALFQYALIFYVPMLLIATVQMRIFNLRTLLAAGIGMITPVWLVLGFGIISPSDLSLPRLVSIFANHDSWLSLPDLLSFGLTALLAVAGIIINVFKYIAYNARTRAYNGMLLLMTLWTIILMCVDFDNAALYQPLLITLSSCQLGHYFSVHRYGRSYIPVLIIIIMYLSLYAWNLVI